MRNVLYAVTLLLLVGAAYVAYALYEKFVGDHSVRIVESIQHELAATDEFVFSRDRMSFSETQNNKAGLAHVNYLYTWQASVPFGFRAGDLDLSFEKASKTLSVRVKKLQLLDFTISAQKSQKTSEFAWLNQGEPAQKFWEGVNAHTRRLINAEFAKDRRLVGDVVQITRSSLTAAVLQILNKLNLSGLRLEVVIDQLSLYDNRVIKLERAPAA